MIIYNETKEITLFEHPELDAAKKIIKQRKQELVLLNLVGIINLATSFALFLGLGISNNLAIGWGFLPFAIGGILEIMYQVLLIPYRKLNRLARKNDMIRHEEMIKIKERERYKETKNIPIKLNNKVIKDTFKSTEITKTPPKKPPIKENK